MKNYKKGKLITIEGCEGVGKSSQINLLKEYCVKNNIDAIFTREPGGTKTAEKIRDIILHSKKGEVDDKTELLLYIAARSAHIAEVIKPNLMLGKIVFCDRFTDSTLAYQGYGRGMDIQKIKNLNDWVLGDIKIDCTVFLDLSPQAGFKRKGGIDTTDRVESEGLEFHNKVYNGFKDIEKQDKERFISVDASGSVGEIHDSIVKALKKIILTTYN